MIKTQDFGNTKKLKNDQLKHFYIEKPPLFQNNNSYKSTFRKQPFAMCQIFKFSNLFWYLTYYMFILILNKNN